jgi:hypothetical protein
MADDEDEEPAVTLGEGEPVEGAPLARISARLMWGIERSAIEEREGDTEIRTPDGPRTLASILDDVEQTYFATRQEFESAVRDVIGHGAVPTAEDDSDMDDEGDAEAVAEDEDAPTESE